MNGPVDISPDHLKVVEEILHKNLPSGVVVWVFGSRASWATRDSSDLDLALKGGIDHDTMLALEMAFEDSILPYTVDIIDLDQVSDSFRRIVDEQKVIFPTIKDRSNTENSWHMASLKEIVDLRISDVDKKTKNGEHLVRLCNYTDVYNNRFINADMDFMTATATEHEIFKRLLSCGDVIITKDSEKCDDIGVPALVCEDIPNLVCGYHLAILRPSKKIDGTYLYYALNTDGAQHQFQSYANGTTRFGLREADICLVQIPYPPLDEQRSISYILRTLDDKIDLNRRMSRTLEAMARALFKSWFVDFDPVRAKMNGRWRRGESLPWLPAHLYDLFSDHLVYSELGEIPVGWDVKTLGELCHKPQYGYSASAKTISAGPKFLRVADINKQPWIEWFSVPYCAINKTDFSKYRLHKGDILIARTADPGHGIMIEDDKLEAVFASDLIRFQPMLESNSRLFQYWLRSDTYWKLVKSAGGETTRVSLNAKVVSKFPLITPPDHISDLFGNIINTIRQRVLACIKESNRLVAIRDTLLPKIITGELRTTISQIQQRP